MSNHSNAFQKKNIEDVNFGQDGQDTTANSFLHGIAVKM